MSLTSCSSSATPGTSRFVAGDWADSGRDTPGLYRPAAAIFYFRHTLTQGNADNQFLYENGQMVPVAGDFGALPGGDPAPPGPILGQAALVTNIVDGDTVDVKIGNSIDRVRLIGIDSPESGQCYFGEAKNRLSSLIGGQTVTLVKDISERDQFNRLLRYVYLGAQHINRTMVREGYAFASEFPPDTAKADELAAAEVAAESEGRGVWGDCVPQQPNCDPLYPTVCISTPPPDLGCPEIPFDDFTVIGNDPHGFDGDDDGIGCET